MELLLTTLDNPGDAKLYIDGQPVPGSFSDPFEVAEPATIFGVGAVTVGCNDWLMDKITGGCSRDNLELKSF